MGNRALEPPSAPPAEWLAFGRRRAQLSPGAHDADYIALRAGLKPIVRELTTRSAWPALRRRIEVAGLAWRLGEEPVTPAAGGGLLRTGGSGRVVAVGAHEEAQDDVLRLEAATTGEGSDPEDIAAIGRLLGYPSCCVEAFVALHPLRDNRAAVADAAGRTERFEPLLNNVQLTLPRHVPWFPCRYDCPDSLRYAGAVDALLPASWEPVRAMARRPRLYLDDRRQIILGVGDAFTPFALDGRDEAVRAEWDLYRRVAVRLAAGDSVTVGETELEVRLAGRVLDRVPRPEGCVWLPWAAP